MSHPMAHRIVLSLLSLLPTLMPGWAAELPVTAVTVLPDGLLVECRGTLAAGDLTINGLPLGCVAEDLALSADDGSEPVWRLIPAPAVRNLPPVVADDLLALTAASRNAGIAGKRAEIAGLIGIAGALPTTDAAGHELAVWSPSALNSQLAFAAINAQRAAEAAQAAADAETEARGRLAQMPAMTTPAGPQIALAVAASGSLTLRYRLGGAQWSPTWRIELDAQGALLVQSAVITLDRRPSSAPVALTVTSFGQQPPLLLPEPRITLYGLGEAMTIEKPADPLVAATQSAKNSQSTVDTGLRTLMQQQQADGSWSNGRSTTITTALATLTFLGAGYDARVPSRYRTSVSLALTWLTAQAPRNLDLPSLALATLALAEATAMADDRALKEKLTLAVTTLRARWKNELAPWRARDGALAGPEIACYVALALKSALAAGLDVGDDLGAIEVSGPDRDEERLAQAMVNLANGRTAGITLDEARNWAAAGPRWLASGRSELLYGALLASFQQGDEVWRVVSTPIRALLAERADPDGLWSTPHPLGRLTGSLFLLLGMETYHRYNQLRSKTGITADVSTWRWPVRVTASDPVRLHDGQQLVELRRIRLPGALRRESVPAVDPTVWRVLVATNPWPGALPPGPLAVVVDGQQVGLATMPETAAAGELRLALGADERYRIRREATTTTEEHLLSRTLTLNVACTLEGPAGASDPVTIREALPEPDDEAISVALITPLSLTGAAYRERLKRDPTVGLELRPGATTQVWSATFNYPRALRPRLENR